jgi:hypothetical protein
VSKQQVLSNENTASFCQERGHYFDNDSHLSKAKVAPQSLAAFLLHLFISSQVSIAYRSVGKLR